MIISELLKIAHEADDWMDTPIESDKWRNLNFDRNGKSYRGLNLWPSEAICRQRQLECENRRSLGLTIGLETLDGVLLYTDYSHTIQMPVKE